MRGIRCHLLILAALSPVACSSLNQGVLDAGRIDGAAEVGLDAGAVLDASSDLGAPDAGADAAVSDISDAASGDNPNFTGAISNTVLSGSSLRHDDLAAGTWYWRVQGVSRTVGNLGAQVSPTWQFIVGRRNSAVDRSFGTVSDFNRDGFGDVVVGASGVGSGAAYLLRSGGAPGLAATPLLLDPSAAAPSRTEIRSIHPYRWRHPKHPPSRWYQP